MKRAWMGMLGQGAWLYGALGSLLCACGTPAEAYPDDSPISVESAELKNGTLVDGGSQWRGVVRLQILWPNNFWMDCTGQIGSRATVITAAHCVQGALGNASSGDVTMLITRENSSGVVETIMPQSTTFTKYHSFFDGRTAFHDVAVITAPAPFSNIVQSDALPIAKTAPSGQSMWALGYGYADVGSAAIDGHGRAGKVTPTYSSVNHDYSFTPGAGQPWMCGGDSGGPLKMLSGTWRLFGVASWYSVVNAGYKCGNPIHWASTLDNYAWLQAAIGYDKCTETSTAIFCW